MEIEKIPTADLLDILFEGRNKLYGAYDLRKTYNGRLARALAFTGSLVLLLIGGYVLAGKIGDKHLAPPTIADVVVGPDPIPKDKPVVIPPPVKLPAPQVATIAVNIPKIVKDIDVNEAPPTVDDMENVKIGTVNKAGIPDGDIVAPPAGDGLGKGITEAPPRKDNPDSIFMKVEIESSYSGGDAGWKRFLERNYKTPEEALANETGGTVVVTFIVDREGNVSNVAATSGPEVLRSEAERVIKKSGKWKPAQQNGRFVNSYKSQAITVQVAKE